MFIYNYFNNLKKKDNIKEVDKDDKLSKEIYFLEFKIVGDFENNECIICLDNMKKDDDIIIIKCGHKYHKTCLMKWFNKKKICPECDFLIE
jgi:hypothetical protein